MMAASLAYDTLGENMDVLRHLSSVVTCKPQSNLPRTATITEISLLPDFVWGLTGTSRGSVSWCARRTPCRLEHSRPRRQPRSQKRMPWSPRGHCSDSAAPCRSALSGPSQGSLLCSTRQQTLQAACSLDGQGHCSQQRPQESFLTVPRSLCPNMNDFCTPHHPSVSSCSRVCMGESCCTYAVFIHEQDV